MVPECVLRVKLRHSPGVPRTSGAGGKADEIKAKVFQTALINLSARFPTIRRL